MSDNLNLWNAVEKTPRAQTKAITGKSYQGTSPKPYYLVQKATETFGPCGIGWGFTIEDERIEEGAGGERMSIARIKVWYKWNGERGEVEHIGGTQFSGVRSSGKPFTDEDAPKKSVTDALIKALSMIGFAGDIFMGRYDDSKYDGAQASEADKPQTSKLGSRTDSGPGEPGGKDFWKCEGPGMTAHAAKAAKLDMVHEDMRSELDRIPTGEAFKKWCEDNLEDIQKMPLSWRQILRSEAEERGRELGVIAS